MKKGVKCRNRVIIRVCTPKGTPKKKSLKKEIAVILLKILWVALEIIEEILRRKGTPWFKW